MNRKQLSHSGLRKDVVKDFVLSCFQPGEVKKESQNVNLDELFEYYKIYCDAYQVDRNYDLNQKRFVTALKEFLSMLRINPDWQKAGLKRDDLIGEATWFWPTWFQPLGLKTYFQR